VALAAGPLVHLSDLPEAMRGSSASPFASVIRPSTIDFPLRAPTTLAESREVSEIRVIQETLLRHRNNRRRAAAELGISRMGLYKKLHKYGLMESTASVGSIASAG